jgi:hypothetical protein
MRLYETTEFMRLTYTRDQLLSYQRTIIPKTGAGPADKILPPASQSRCPSDRIKPARWPLIICFGARHCPQRVS